MAKKVCLIIASESDKDIGDKAAEVLGKFNIPYDYEQASAHRNPKRVEEIVRSSDADVFIAVAGLAGALPGFVASITNKPVIGVPKDVKLLGLDALLSMVQMPPGIPVATVGIDNGKNAAYLAIRILGIKYPEALGAEGAMNPPQSSSNLSSYSSQPAQGKAVLEKFEPPASKSLDIPAPATSFGAFPLFASDPSTSAPQLPSPIASTLSPSKPQTSGLKPQADSAFGNWGLPQPKPRERPKGDWFR